MFAIDIDNVTWYEEALSYLHQHCTRSQPIAPKRDRYYFLDESSRNQAAEYLQAAQIPHTIFKRHVQPA